LLTKSVQENSAMVAMAAGLLLMLAIKQWTHIAFTWYVLIGTTATFLTGCVVSQLRGETRGESSNVRKLA
jgi:solute:Na+ symporter, SSS family